MGATLLLGHSKELGLYSEGEILKDFENKDIDLHFYRIILAPGKMHGYSRQEHKQADQMGRLLS